MMQMKRIYTDKNQLTKIGSLLFYFDFISNNIVCNLRKSVKSASSAFQFFISYGTLHDKTFMEYEFDG